MSKTDNIQITRQKAELWSNHSDKNNFIQNKEFLQQHVCKFDELTLNTNHWIFSHIPKTAGTSCENYLAQMFLIQNILHINAPDLNQLPEVFSLKRQFPLFIAGHHPMHGLLYQLLPNKNFVHLTMLREPVARVLSYYNYLRSRETHVLHTSVIKLDFDTFLQQTMVELHNGQARRLTGLLHSDEKIDDLELFECAKTVIDNCFTLVGVTEKIESFIELIEKRCGVKINRSARKNPSKISLSLNDLSSNQLQLIQNNNTADFMLYDYVLEKFSKIEMGVSLNP